MSKMSLELFHQYRFVVVIAMLAVAVSLATGRGKMPLALRGLRRLLQQDAGVAPSPAADGASATVPTWRRLLALLLVLAAFAVAVAL